MSNRTENRAMQSGQILYTFVLRAEVFRPQYKSLQNLPTLLGYIFRTFTTLHFAAKIGHVTKFSMIILEIPFLSPELKVSLSCQRAIPSNVYRVYVILEWSKLGEGHDIVQFEL